MWWSELENNDKRFCRFLEANNIDTEYKLSIHGIVPVRQQSLTVERQYGVLSSKERTVAQVMTKHELLTMFGKRLLLALLRSIVVIDLQD